MSDSLRWNEALAYRCAPHCKHGRDGRCAHEEVAGRGKTVPLEEARSRGGACGPDAIRMEFKR
jgi:hypothetical protein